MIPVIFISTLLNIPKFLESDIKYYDPWVDFSTGNEYWSFPGEFEHNGSHIFVNSETSANRTLYKHISELNSTSEWEVLFDGSRYDMNPRVGIVITWLRNHPRYMKYYTHWTQLFVKAIIPTVLLIYFNYKVSFLNFPCCS